MFEGKRLCSGWTEVGGGATQAKIFKKRRLLIYLTGQNGQPAGHQRAQWQKGTAPVGVGANIMLSERWQLARGRLARILWESC